MITDRKVNIARGIGWGRWKLAATVEQDWTEWFSSSGYNWQNFTVIALDWEWATYFGETFEIHVAFFGFHLTVEVYDSEVRQKEATKWDAAIEEMEREREAEKQ